MQRVLTRASARVLILGTFVLALVLPAAAMAADPVGSWYYADDPAFKVRIDADGTGTHTAGASGCFDDTVSPYYRGLTQIDATVWRGERLLGNVCENRWVMTEIEVLSDGQTYTERISTGATLSFKRLPEPIVGSWYYTDDPAFKVRIDADGTGTHTEGASGCFDDAVSPYYRGLTEISATIWRGERLLGNVCENRWVTTEIELSPDGQTYTERISTGATITFKRIPDRIVGSWYYVDEPAFRVRIDPDGTGTHTAGASGCFDATVSPYYRGLTKITATIWRGQRLLGNVCENRWVTTEIELSPDGQTYTERISTGATVTFRRIPEVIEGTWSYNDAPAFTVRIAGDGTGTHTAGASGCFDDTVSPYYRGLTKISATVWRGERLLGNVCEVRWVDTEIEVSPAGHSYTERISTGATIGWTRVP